MADFDGPSKPEEQVMDAINQGSQQPEIEIQDNVQVTQAGEAPKVDDIAAGRKATPEDSQDVKEAEKQDEEPQPSKLKLLWEKLGLDAATLVMMFKGSVPPLITIAFYQAPAVAATYGSLGYLVPIISVISLSIMPRAKYIQTLILNTLGICIGSAVGLLGIWSSIQARIHTTPTGTKAAYNSSQSAVCAIWLFVNIWLVNLLRAKFPAMQFPSLMYSIFASVAFTFGPVFQTMDQAESLIKELLEGFLTAFAVSTAVSLFIVPISSRTVVFGEMTGYIGAIRATIKAQTAYLQSLEKSDMFSQPGTEDANSRETKKDKSKKDKKTGGEKSSIEKHPESNALKASIASLTELHGKLHGDLPFGKREIAYGKLGPADLDELFKLFRAILIPLIGMSTITDIFERIAARRGWVKTEQNSEFNEAEEWEHDPTEEAKKKEKQVWNEIMKQLHDSFTLVSGAMDEGLEHAGLLLELVKAPKAKPGITAEADVEAKGDEVKPGDKGFADYLEKKLADFYSKRGQTLKTWAQGRGLSAEQWDAAKSPGVDGTEPTADENHHRRDQQQLYLILYMEFLLYSTGSAILNFIRFAESKGEDGTMKKSRLIHPGQRRLRNWITSLGSEDSNIDATAPDSLEGGTSTVYLGSGFNRKKDPEHLPPTTLWQRAGNGIRMIPHFFGSVESAFGFRVALATMTIGIVAFLESTQTFFLEQRIVWALVITAISMTVTAGQSVFGLLARTGGTAVAMILSYVIWYIVDQNTAGIIFFLWLFIFLEFYFLIKFPRFIPVWLVCIVTQVLIIGYELQVQVIGIAAAGASGQPYYPIYELGPYRLACVIGGCVVAFIWTIFPYPLTDRSWLRKDLGAAIYLLANYYSIVHSTVRARINRTEGNMEDKNSPGRQLEKGRQKIFGKLLLLLPSLRQHADWQKFEPALGGKFPAATYNSIIMRVTNIMNYMSLVSYATQTWSTPSFPHSDPSAPSHHEWLSDLAILLNDVGPTTHIFTSTLTLLSASVIQGSALPPYIVLPESYGLSRRLEKLDKGILDAKHVEEPGYSAYAVMQVATSLLTDDLKRLVEDVKSLVGEVDFSFEVVNSEVSSESDVAGQGQEPGAESGKGKQD